MVTTSVAPPASTGAAGAQFEAKVGAYYLLAMLRGAEPRGLPDRIFDRVELQRAAEGHPLDDIIVHGHDQRGAEAVLEVQVKRAISFAPRDQVFEEVVRQIAAVVQKSELLSSHYELAIATAQTTRVITGAYQEVLNWARKMGSAIDFLARINRTGSANDQMRTFVATLQSHLRQGGAAHDDETVWQVLRRLQIHVYDFTAVGSASESHARDRAADVLHPDAKGEAGALWSALIEYALDLAASGGDATRQDLFDALQGRFRFEGERRYSIARAAIAEASKQALDDIFDKVGGVALGRHARIASIRTAADTGRFILICGAAGVGKSALLKHLAEEAARESRVLVLAPGRVPQGGWSALRNQIGFDGTAKELLSDLACDGGGWVFIDNLDFIAPEERPTVNDLVRAAAGIPGVIVTATARERFGLDEPSWLPEDAICCLGRADTVRVNELSEEEVAELREAEPKLRALLAGGHPAKAVTRNLFRLSRLIQAPEGAREPRSEVDMAELWWQTADGAPAETRRERGRLLRELAALSLKGDQSFDVTSHPPSAVDALIKTESLRDLGNDRVAFRHDVLREWAIANLIVSKPVTLDQLPFAQVASPALARGVELAARIVLEMARDLVNWRRLLDTVSGVHAHPSWRRAVLLAMAHSEIADELVTLMEETLLANDAALLRELIPIMIAVDVRSIRDVYATASVDASVIPDTLNIPSSPGWWPLVEWLLQLGDKLPAAAIPAVIDLLLGWCNIGVITPDLLPHAVLERLKTWLVDIEKSNDAESWRDSPTVFGGELSHKDLQRIEENLRAYFTLFSDRVPDIAKDYLRFVQTLRRKEDVYAKLLKSHGTLAQAAPEELAAITLDALLHPEEESKKRGNRWYNDALTHVDHGFLPASPEQGPFFDLLTHAPAVGLQLIRSLIDRVIDFHSKGEAADDHDTILIELSGGTRRFPWVNTYGWSRSSGYFSITSALMALEAWAHARAKRGDAIDAIVADVIGPPDAPAAYLLVVVDILLSHWPESRAAAIPYIACPELLSLDLVRPVQESFNMANISGPAGPKLEALRSRASRRVSLDHLLPRYANNRDWNDLRERVAELMTKAADRLGPYQRRDDLGCPRLMAFHALNMLDPGNYVDVEIERDDGEKVSGRQFEPPAAEAKHFELLQKVAFARDNDVQAMQWVVAAVDNPERSSPELAEALVEWAQNVRTPDPDDDVIADNIVAVAMIAIRDGGPELRARIDQWAQDVFAKALATEPDRARFFRTGMLHNPIAIAFAGRVFALRKSSPTRDELKRILGMAGGDPAAAHGAPAAALALRTIDARLPRAVLRVAFAASVRPWRRSNANSTANGLADERLRDKVNSQISSELTWLCGDGVEPAWPLFPREAVRSRSRLGMRIGAVGRDTRGNKSNPRKTFVDHQAAALWLRGLWDPSETNRDWLRDLLRTYAAWTFSANGAGLPEEEETAEQPSDWNSIFFTVLANCLPGWPQPFVEAAIAPIFTLQDKNFYDVVAELLRDLDVVYFNNAGIGSDIVVAVRARIAERLERSHGWQLLRGTKSDGIEMHLARAAAVQFFNDHDFGQTPRCYLPINAIEKSLVFIPTLQELAVSAPSPFVAIVVLNLLEVAPRVAQMPFLLAFSSAALDTYPDDRDFWIDLGIGRRICQWMASVRDEHPGAFGLGADNRPEIDRLLARLVAVGVVEAHRLEVVLNVH